MTTSSRSSSRRRMIGAGVAVAGTAVVVVGLGRLVDWSEVGAGMGRAASDPAGAALALSAFAAAFALRAWAWTAVVPALGFGTALASIHVALGANHVLPFRLGEPLRIVSAVRRSDAGVASATASTVVLRSADVIALLAVGTVAGPAVMWRALGLWAVAAVVAAVAAIVAVAVVVGRLPSTARRLGGGWRAPAPIVAAAAMGAWLCEAIVVWQAARWFGVMLAPADAVVVLAAAVTVQLLAFTPGGVGTYEAAAVAALTAVGVDPAQALTVAVGIHAIKTLYSVAAGAVGLLVPSPSLFGHVRLPPIERRRGRPDPGPSAATGPVVLFLPALDEAPRIGAVIDRVPGEVDGHPVEVIVVDDGSTDGTAHVAREHGATVVAHPERRGLGAAVRTGLGTATRRGAVAVAFCDADGEYDPAELDRLVRPILYGDADYVVGDRFHPGRGHMRPHRWFGNRVLTRWVRFTTREAVHDGQSGYRALSAGAAAEARIVHDYNYAQVLTVDLLARGFRYREVPISYAFRTSGRSFVRLGTYLAHVVPAVWRQLNPSPTRTGTYAAGSDHEETHPCPPDLPSPFVPALSQSH